MSPVKALFRAYTYRRRSTLAYVSMGYDESGPTTSLFSYEYYIGDNSTVRFDTNHLGQTIHTVIVIIDGIMQSAGLDYTMDNVSLAPKCLVHFTTAPPTGTNIVILAAPYPSLMRSFMYAAVGNGVISFFSLPLFASVTAAQVMVALNGVVQRVPDYSISTTGITFSLLLHRIIHTLIFSFFMVRLVSISTHV
jgi:hypothetical protein